MPRNALDSTFRRLRGAVKTLDRPGGRTLLRAVASAGLTVKLRTPVLLRRRGDAWAYRWEGATLPYPTLGTALHPLEAKRILLFDYVPKPGDIAFDVGAGVGDTTLVLSKLVGHDGRVVAIEAHPETYAWLSRTCALNDLPNVTTLQVAASDREGSLLMSDESSISNTLLTTQDGRDLEVPGRTIDGIASELGIESIDFLKMNIEGAERLALRGMERMIRRTRHVCISCHDFMADRGGPDEMRTKAFVSDFLMSRGFTLVERTSRVDAIRSYVYGRNTLLS